MADNSCHDTKVSGIRKVASFKLVDAKPFNFNDGLLVKEASSKSIDGNSDMENVLKAEMEKNPTALFFRARAIEADVPNNNGDFFSTEELKKSAQSFVGVPFFTNHQNSDVEKAKGKIVFAEWDNKEKAIYVVAFVDREAYPSLCRGIKQGYVVGVSMGMVSEDSEITMADLSLKKISEVEVGDKVLTPYGNSCNVDEVYSGVFGKNMFTLDIVTYHKSPILSDDHPIYIVNGEDVRKQQEISIQKAKANCYLRRKERTDDFVGQDGWRSYPYISSFKETKNIKVGDYVLVPTKYSLTENEDYDKDFYYLAGAYVGDGHIVSRKSSKPDLQLNYHIGISEKKFLGEKLCTLLQKFHSGNITKNLKEETNCLTIGISNKDICKTFVDKFGRLAHKKRIYQKSFSRDQICSFISGYIDTDGTICKSYNKTKNGEMRGSGVRGVLISSCNRELMEDVQSLLILLDVSSYITWNYRKPNKNSLVQIPTLDYSLFIPYGSLFLFTDSIKVSSALKEKSVKIKAGKVFIYTDSNGKKFMACPVKNIIEHEYNKPCYDLKVKDDESYIANGIAVHNCSVEYSVCSICGNKAADQDSYCMHIKNMKGRKFTGQVTNVRTGETKTLKEAPVYEDNFGIRFIELSGVVDPACTTCHIQDVFENDEYLKKAANCANGLSVFKESEKFKKEASEQDVQKLNQALEILQDVSIKLIQNRKNIEMEFSADIVQILADLQEYVDGLVQAGFGKLPDSQEEIPGNMPEEQGAVPGEAPVPGAELAPAGAAPGAAQPIAEEQPLGAGSVSGQDGAPLAAAPTPPDLSSFKNTTRPSPTQRSTMMPLVKPKKGESESMRRIPGEVSGQRIKISSTLQTDWQEKLEKISNRLKDSLLVDIGSNGENNSSGGTIMSNQITKEAKAQEVENAVIEKRLDTGIRLHPREGEPKQDVETKQLAELHEGDPNVTEQVLLEKVRTGNTPEKVEEINLEGNREGDVVQDIENKHLEKQRVGREGNEITEKQLSHPAVDTPLTRSSSSIKDHVEAAVDIVGRTVVCAQSTPERVIKVAGSFATATVSEQTALVGKIAKFAGEIPSHDDSKQRSDKEVKDLLVAFASKSVKDKSLNPEFVIRAFAVLKSNPNAVTVVGNKVKEIVASGSLTQNVEDEMGSYLTAMDKTAKGMPQGLKDYLDKKNGKEPEKKEDAKGKYLGKKCEKCGKAECECEKKCDTVKAETEILEKALSKEAKDSSGLMIETSFDEMGVPVEAREDDVEVARIADGFARGACAHMGVKVAAVVNVTVDGESGDVVIAVDTENGSVEIPVGGEESSEEPELPEDTEDIEGDKDIGTSTPAMPEAPPAAGGAGAPDQFGATTPPPAAGGAAGLGTFTSKKGKVKTAQFGGGGGAPPTGNDPNAMAKPADPTADLGGAPAPGEDAGLGSFTEGDVDADEDEGLPGDEEQKEAGTTCPICGSSDTETGRKDQGPGQFDCNSCGVKYTYTVNVELLNPKELLEDQADIEGEIEAPEAPAMPVAAEVSLDRNSMKKISKVQKDVGHVCPACGSNEVDAKGEPSDVKLACKKCKTESEKSVMINVDNPVESMIRIAWATDPMKRKCKECRKNAKKFAADMVFEKLVKRAEKVAIPESKVHAWLKANYPEIEYVTNGPYKGQAFADTVVSQLKTFGLGKVKHMKALAEAQSQEDPMDTCVRDHKKKGYNLAESKRLCNCLKEKYASEEDDNIYAQAFPGFNKNILKKMASYNPKKMTKEAVVSKINDEDSLSALPEAPKAAKPSTKAMAQSLKAEIKKAVDLKQPDPEVAKKGDETHTKEQKNTEKGVDADGIVKKDNHMICEKEDKASPSRGAIGGELKEEIPSPDVPRGDATMGKEVKPPAEGVDIPSKEKGIDTSALGTAQTEASNKGDKMKKNAYAEQEPMKSKSHENPQIDNTSGDTALDEKSNTEKKVKEVESIEEKDNVPRGDAVINKENKFDAKGPDVPRGTATMGNENPPKAQEISIPSEVAETQVEMRGRNETEAARNVQLEKVAAARREHAQRFAGQLLERGIIKESESDDFVRDLSAMSIDRMKAHVAILLKSTSTRTVQASQPASPTLTTAIVNESVINTAPQNEQTLAEKLASCFTIGGKDQNRAIRMRMAEEEKESADHGL